MITCIVVAFVMYLDGFCFSWDEADQAAFHKRVAMARLIF